MTKKEINYIKNLLINHLIEIKLDTSYSEKDFNYTKNILNKLPGVELSPNLKIMNYDKR